MPAILGNGRRAALWSCNARQDDLFLAADYRDYVFRWKRCVWDILKATRLIAPPTKATSMGDLRYEELFHERVCVAVAPQHPFA